MTNNVSDYEFQIVEERDVENACAISHGEQRAKAKPVGQLTRISHRKIIAAIKQDQ